VLVVVGIPQAKPDTVGIAQGFRSDIAGPSLPNPYSVERRPRNPYGVEWGTARRAYRSLRPSWTSASRAISASGSSSSSSGKARLRRTASPPANSPPLPHTAFPGKSRPPGRPRPPVMVVNPRWESRRSTWIWKADGRRGSGKPTVDVDLESRRSTWIWKADGRRGSGRGRPDVGSMFTESETRLWSSSRSNRPASEPKHHKKTRGPDRVRERVKVAAPAPHLRIRSRQAHADGIA
jgi:hypothetical protein